jgi:hypothetical protein
MDKQVIIQTGMHVITAGASEEKWYGWGDSTAPAQAEAVETTAVTKRASRKAWARLLAKVYEIA